MVSHWRVAPELQLGRVLQRGSHRRHQRGGIVDPRIDGICICRWRASPDRPVCRTTCTHRICDVRRVETACVRGRGFRRRCLCKCRRRIVRRRSEHRCCVDGCIGADDRRRLRRRWPGKVGVDHQLHVQVCNGRFHLRHVHPDHRWPVRQALRSRRCRWQYVRETVVSLLPDHELELDSRRHRCWLSCPHLWYTAVRSEVSRCADSSRRDVGDRRSLRSEHRSRRSDPPGASVARHSDGYRCLDMGIPHRSRGSCCACRVLGGLGSVGHDSEEDP